MLKIYEAPAAELIRFKADDILMNSFDGDEVGVPEEEAE